MIMKWCMKKIIIITFIFIFVSSSFCEKFVFKFDNGDLVKISIRANYKIYQNNKYSGLRNKEVKGVFKIACENDKYYFDGSVYIIEKTIRGSVIAPDKINSTEKCHLVFRENGELIEHSGCNFPPIQGFPVFPEDDIDIGDIYSGNGILNFPILHENTVLELPFSFNAQYKGVSPLNGVPYNYFEQSFTIGSYDSNSDESAVNARHNIKFYFYNEHGKSKYMEDRFEDFIKYKSGEIVCYRGFYLYFYDIVQSLDKKNIIDSIKITDNEGYVKETGTGISITLDNLHFKPDSTEIMDNDIKILENIGDSLKNIPNRSFLIVGHTADTGNPQEEMKLSEDRALSVANFFQKIGINIKQLQYSGRGALEPIAPNDTEENKKKNRRVEILILED